MFEQRGIRLFDEDVCCCLYCVVFEKWKSAAGTVESMVFSGGESYLEEKQVGFI